VEAGDDRAMGPSVSGGERGAGEDGRRRVADGDWVAESCEGHQLRHTIAVVSAEQTMAPSQRRMLGGILAIVGGGLIVLGAFLPWVKATAAFVGTITRSGMEGGDGPIFLAAGFVIAGIGLWCVLARPTLAPALLILGGLAVGGSQFSSTTT
jgi:hypothetical protein